MKASPFHFPVLLDEALALLMTDPAGIYTDATVGAGGHAAEICRRLTGSGRAICFDADEEALREAGSSLAPFADRVSLVHANFRDMKEELRRQNVEKVAGILLDLGVSSHQLDEARRGFSYTHDGPLDMRMSSAGERDASRIVNGYSEQALAALIREYGEEKNARRIAARIVAARPVLTTRALSEAVRNAVGGRFLTKSLARVFQAIRIEVNGELENLKQALAASVDLLLPGGRLVVISYHSLEDRIVKEYMKAESARVIPSGHKLVPDTPRLPRLKVLTRKPVTPGAAEAGRNPRSRSAKLRAAERLPDR